MAVKHRNTEALSTPERRRVEALALAIAMQPGRYPDVDAYLIDAEAIERWIIDANGGREHDLPAFVEADDGDDRDQYGAD